MTTIAIRNLLFEYIRFAEEKKVKALYTIIEDEINEMHNHWTKAFVLEMKKRSEDLDSGKAKGKEWSEVQKKAKNILLL